MPRLPEQYRITVRSSEGSAVARTLKTLTTTCFLYLFNSEEFVRWWCSLISTVSFKTMTSAPPVERILVCGEPLLSYHSFPHPVLALLLISPLRFVTQTLPFPLLFLSPPFFPCFLSSSPFTDPSLLPHRCHEEKGHQSISYQGARVDLGVTFYNLNLTFMAFCRVGVHVYFPCVHTRQATCPCPCVCMIRSVWMFVCV